MCSINVVKSSGLYTEGVRAMGAPNKRNHYVRFCLKPQIKNSAYFPLKYMRSV